MDLTFDASPETITRARRLLTVWLLRFGIHEAIDLTLAVSELVTNAVRHGKPPIRLRVDCDARRVRVEVHDHGGGRPAIRRAQKTGPASGGWGLQFVDRLADRWGTYTTGDLTVVWLERATGSLAGPAPPAR